MFLPWRSSLIPACVALAISSLAGPPAQALADGPFVFGPRSFTKEKPGQESFAESFVVKLEANVGYELRIRNGDGDRKHRVTAAEIYLNGSEVVSEADFNSMVEEIRASVGLKPQNELTINIKGEPGSTMTVAIAARRNHYHGYRWSGILSSTPLVFQGGQGQAADALVQLKAVSGPLTARIVLYDQEGKRVFISKPIWLRNHASRLYNLEEVLGTLVEESAAEWGKDPGEWRQVSVEVNWVSKFPSRLLGSVTWLDERQGSKRAVSQALEAVFRGRVACPRCDPKPATAEGTAAGPELTGRETVEMLEAAREAAE